MKFTLNRWSTAARSRAAFPALLLLVHATSGCSEDDPRPQYVPPASGGSGDGDGDGDGDDPINMGGDGGEGTGGAGADGSGGAFVEETPCEEAECHALAECDDSSGTAECVCPEGLEGEECTDANECLDPSVCDPGMTCINTHGGFLCRCPDGQVNTADGCTDILECDSEPCDENATCTESADSFSCSCDSGYFGNGFFCSDTDNCAESPCGENGTCITTPSGYVCQCEPGFGGASDCAATACDTLSFPDPALDAAVRTAINKPSGSILQADIQNTIALYLAGENVEDLAGLECWSHLEILDLNDTPIGEMPDSLNALSELNRLRALYLGCTAISDLELLSEHPTLERLSVARYESCQSGAVDLSALDSITALRWLDISGIEVDSLAPVGGLTALEYLVASNNSIASVAPVSTLLNLKGLRLDGNQLSDITALSGLTLLEELDLAQNQISSMNSLTSLAFLQTLSLGDNELTSLSDLSSFDNLNFFDARNNQIDSLSGIASLGPMMWLGLAGNEISSLDDIVGTALSGSLSVRDNPIDCDAEADNLSSLASQGLSVISDCSN